MKYLFILSFIFLYSCQQSGHKKTIPEIEDSKGGLANEKMDTLENQQEQNQPDSIISQFDPKLFNRFQTDTLKFIDYQDDFDYRYLIGEKNGKNLSFVYNWDWTENQDYNFRQGDLILIQWKLDSIQMAGDEEIVKQEKRVLEAKKIASGKLPIQFLTRVNRYDESVKATVSAIVINQSFLYNISQPERAALGYVAYNIGNECEWAEDSDGNRILYCQIVSALNLDYQCSDTQLNFLRKWFSKDSVASDNLKSCPTIPNTATIQSTFDEILIEKDEFKKTITVKSKIDKVNLRESKSWAWTQTDLFEYTQDHISLIDSKISVLVENEIDLNPDHDHDHDNAY
ncbi:hypothetical protein [Algoriphagus sp. PAP.12]|uniref:hypothetical protein n=1 Tax=Algoriphagus sp. PAP.12 TaxID=2996678 RepID=UPI00227D378E|nr:hypothetical protein [Algoriphagus sp. PAP.12]